jgi:UDP-glucose 4-epimerase
MQVAVTGGAGFIGHHLVGALVDLGHRVRVVDDLSSGRADRLARHGDRVELIRADVREAIRLAEAFRGADVVYHLAAIPSVARSVDEPLATNGVNVDGTLAVVEAAAAARVRRVVLASSCSVYGDQPELPHHEDLVPMPGSPYAAGKLAAEHYLHSLGRIRGVESVALRFFNVYGPGQDPASDYAAVVPRFLTAAVRRQRPIVFGDGRQTRDFVHVDDVVAANLLAGTVPAVSGLTANIASGASCDLLGLLDVIRAAAPGLPEPEMRPARAGDIVRSSASIARAGDTLGYRPAVSLAAGIARTLAWYRTAEAGADAA